MQIMSYHFFGLCCGRQGGSSLDIVVNSQSPIYRDQPAKEEYERVLAFGLTVYGMGKEGKIKGAQFWEEEDF